jgi:uncharacterized membrane protein
VPDTSVADHVKSAIAYVFTIVLIVAMTLGAMFALVETTNYVTSIDSSLPRAGAIIAELLLGVILLLGTVWVATHFAVRIFGKNEPPSSGGTLA